MLKTLAICSLFFISQIQAAKEYQKFDWGKVLALPPGAGQVKGNQIMHFKATNKPYTNDPEAVRFVQQNFQGAACLEADAEALRFGSDQVTLDGLYLELGMGTGRTVNFIAALNPKKTVYGFDSFEGLPEAWVRKDKIFPKGTFGFKTPSDLPYVLHNVEIVPGMFTETLAKFASTHTEPIAFMYIDCDLYSSTHEALELLGDLIQPGTILVFDEFYNYPGAEDHEFRAFQEFLETSGLKANYLAYNSNHEQVVIRIERG